MSDQRFDLSYEGLLIPGADPDAARQRLCAIFKLSAKDGERLFSGKPTVIKRGVDSAAADRYERVFSEAGAVLTIIPLSGAFDDGPFAEQPQPSPVSDQREATPGPRPLPSAASSGLALAPQGDDLEEPAPPPERVPRTDHLSLVSGSDWTLQDCETQPIPIPPPDLSGLSLVPMTPREESEPGFGGGQGR